MAASPDRKPASSRSVDALRVPPHSIDAEQAVLGGLMLDNDRKVWRIAQKTSPRRSIMHSPKKTIVAPHSEALAVTGFCKTRARPYS